MSLLELGQRKAATQEELNKLKKDLDTTKNKVTTNTNNLTNLTERTVSLETNAAKKNTTNTFTQKQTFRNEVEFGTTIKAGFGGGLINFTPEDNSSKTLKLQRLELDLSDKKIVNVATPTNNNDAANKKYVDDKNSITLTNITEQINNVNTTLTNEINAIKQVNNTQNTEINDIKQKNSEQDTQINNIIQINTTQTNDISSIKTKNTQQDNRLTNIENTNTTQSNQISGIDNRVRTLENTTVGDLSRLTQRVDSVESKNRIQDDDINGLRQTVQGNASNIASLVRRKEFDYQVKSFGPIRIRDDGVNLYINDELIGDSRLTDKTEYVITSGFNKTIINCVFEQYSTTGFVGFPYVDSNWIISCRQYVRGNKSGQVSIYLQRHTSTGPGAVNVDGWLRMFYIV